MSQSWSSKQQLSPKDLTYLQDVLLEMYLKLQKPSQNPLDIMMNSNFGDMTRIISTRKLLENILTSLGSD